jgi:hypothetical protein
LLEPEVRIFVQKRRSILPSAASRRCCHAATSASRGSKPAAHEKDLNLVSPYLKGYQKITTYCLRMPLHSARHKD